jgi:hypothetical protein
MGAAATPAMSEPLYDMLPASLREGIRRYLEEHILPGDFLQAVLKNDLREAALRADDDNRKWVADLALWLHLYAPDQSWGSPGQLRWWEMVGKGKGDAS